MQAEAVIDLNAYRQNLEVLTRAAGGAEVMAVVKADGYGHGMVRMAQAARDVVSWLGVATIDEALALRSAGDQGRLAAWLASPGADYAAAIDQDVELTASSVDQLHEIAAAAGSSGARVQLKVDTGLSRNGSSRDEWPALVEAARTSGLHITGLWSHLASADNPDDPLNAAQKAGFDDAVAYARSAGLEPEYLHLANSAATLTRPEMAYDLVRVGIASYGLDPAPSVNRDFGLRPVMTLRASLAQAKRIAAGAGVSYGHHWIAPRDTTVGLVPIGYGEGIMRASGNRCEVAFNGRRAPIVGVVCMDQFVVDLGDQSAQRGDTVVLFGPGDDGEPTVQDWAEALGTINYEIVTRLGGRITRTYR